MKTKLLVTFFVIILFISACKEIQLEEHFPPEEIISQAITKDSSSRLIGIEMSDKEERYNFAGENVFFIIDKRKTDFYSGENIFGTVDNIKSEYFRDYKTIKSWKIDYEMAYDIARKFEKPFPIHLLNQGQLMHKPIPKQCGAMTNPPYEFLNSKNPYWKIHGSDEMRLFEIYVDSITGEVIHSCYGPRK